jgi:hypothetical protein
MCAHVYAYVFSRERVFVCLFVCLFVCMCLYVIVCVCVSLYARVLYMYV